MVLDTSFLLPFLGVKVRGVDDRVLRKIEEIATRRGTLQLCYHELMLPELIAKAFSTSLRKGLETVPEKAIEGFLSVSSGMFIEVLATTREDLEIAYTLRMAGHGDFFDCIAYAAAKSRRGRLLTLDTELRKSVERAKLDVHVFMDQREFLALCLD